MRIAQRQKMFQYNVILLSLFSLDKPGDLQLAMLIPGPVLDLACLAIHV